MIRFHNDLGWSFTVHNQQMYSDGTPMIKPGAGVFNDIVDYASSITVKADSLMEFVNAMFLVDSVTAMDGRIDTLVLPYIPGARQDRINSSGDVLFTLRSVAEMINQRAFNAVLVLDPHSAVSDGVIKNTVHYPLERVASRVWKGYSGVIAPDKGAKRRAEEFAAVMSKPVYYGSKVRDVSTGRLSGFDIDVPDRGHYLVVDDICDGGGTFIGLADKIHEHDAFADLYVSHGIFSKGTRELKANYKNIYTTDSRNFQRDGVFVLPVVNDMERYIQIMREDDE